MSATGTPDAGLTVIMQTRLLQALLFATVAGCTGTGQVHYGAEVTTPDLVYVSPGVQVIADYDEPIFYSDNYYWRYNGGVWYRSPSHTRGWVRVSTVPVAVRRIDRPNAYIRYRATARADVQRRQERQELINDRNQERREDRRELIKDRNEERADDRQKRQEDRQKLEQQRREQVRRERERR